MFDGDSIASGNVPLILTSQLADGDYNPTETIYGKFQVLECKDCERTIAELKEQYDRKFELTDEEKIWFLSCRKIQCIIRSTGDYGRGYQQPHAGFP